MNLSINKSDLTQVDPIAEYTIHDTFDSSQLHPTLGWMGKNKKAIIPEMAHRFYDGILRLVACGIILLAMILLVIAIDTRILQPGNGIWSPTHYYVIAFIILTNVGGILLCVKYFADCRYFIFEGDTVTMVSRAKGCRVYKVDDLRFHLLKVSGIFPSYEITVELPDSTLTEYERLVIFEESVTHKTMIGLMAVLFPLMRGDDDPLKHATDRKIEPIELGESTGFYWRCEYLGKYAYQWYARYTLNRIMFYLVHGTRAELMEREGLTP